jgi:predicted nucleotidyltransferase component of viral defense system
MNGLAAHTERIFEQISRLDCIKNYVLMGGTALALQLHHRLSEDLDFCVWHTIKKEKLSVDWSNIKKELETIGETKISLLDTYQCDFLLDEVKITFLADNRFKPPVQLQRIPFLNNIQLVDTKSIGIMKMEVMSRRSVFRDYYDMYAILKSGISLAEIIAGTGKYTSHNLRTRDMLAILLNTEYIVMDKVFYEKLNPMFNISLKEIRDFFVEKSKEMIKL